MTKNKWKLIYDGETYIFFEEMGKISDKNPDKWTEIKSIFNKFIQNMDGATEVYRMENKK
jgi:hypothetical protein